jgi:hypothetical protein
MTALHLASLKGHTELAMALVKARADVHSKNYYGYGSRTASSSRWVRNSAGAAGPSTRGVELQEWLFWLCRRTAVQDASHNGHTETAMALVKAGADVHSKDNDGCGFRRLHRRVAGLSQCGGGRSVDSGVGLQEWLRRLCRGTAVHWASQNGHTETAMALVKAGADVHCKDNNGYGPSGCILAS